MAHTYENKHSKTKAHKNSLAEISYALFLDHCLLHLSF